MSLAPYRESEGAGRARPGAPGRLIWLAEVPFAGPPHRQQHLARRCSRDYRVLYVEPPAPLRPPRPGLRRLGRVTVAQVAPLLNAHPLRRVLGWTPMRRLATAAASVQLQLATAALRRRSHRPGHPAPSQLTVICSNVFLIDAALALHPRLLVVDMCDDPRHYPGEPPWTAELLVRAIRAADLVTTSSRALEAEFRQLGARRVAYLPNGIPDAFLSVVPAPRDRAGPPILGFVGHLGPWVDLDLLEQLARALPDTRLELTGSVSARLRPRLERLLRLPNTVLRPPVAHDQVPRVMSRFAVGLIPFVVSPYTRAVNPIKLYEYAALNLPIVATTFSQDLLEFADRIALCSTPDEFVEATRRLASGGATPCTRPIAEGHTWSAAYRQLAELLARCG